MTQSHPRGPRSKLRAIRPGTRVVSDRSEPDAPTGPAEAAATDGELMAGLLAEDVSALERLYDRYATLVFSVSLRIVRDRQIAEDVTQEVFLRLWRRPALYDPARGRLLGWLISVTRNRAIDEQRRRHRRDQSESGETPWQLRAEDRLDDPALAAHLAELRRTVGRALAQLPAAQREAIELAYFGGLTQTEIAERTRAPLGTVKTRVRLGMRHLREMLADLGVDGTP